MDKQTLYRKYLKSVTWNSYDPDPDCEITWTVDYDGAFMEWTEGGSRCSHYPDPEEMMDFVIKELTRG